LSSRNETRERNALQGAVDLHYLCSFAGREISKGVIVDFEGNLKTLSGILQVLELIEHLWATSKWAPEKPEAFCWFYSEVERVMMHITRACD